MEQTNLDNLTERDLLIRLTIKVESVEEDVKELKRDLSERVLQAQKTSTANEIEITKLTERVAENTKLRDRLNGVIIAIVMEFLGLIVLAIKEIL